MQEIGKENKVKIGKNKGKNMIYTSNYHINKDNETVNWRYLKKDKLVGDYNVYEENRFKELVEED